MNQDYTEGAQMTPLQIERFEDCNPLSHGNNLYGLIECRKDGFIIDVYMDAKCKRHAKKNGKNYVQPIFYGRCHKERDGSKFYFKVNKFDPEAMKKA